MITGIEKTLTESVRNGDVRSFELMFKTYYPRLCTYAFQYTRDWEAARDIVKDFFVSFWEHRETIRINTSLSGYLFRSVKNRCINFLEREKPEKTISLEEIRWQELKTGEPWSGEYPHGDLLARELEDRIFREIEKLPDGCREVFTLSRVDGLSHKRIAEQLNVSENTVKSQIYKALKSIRDALFPGSVVLFQFFLKKS